MPCAGVVNAQSSVYEFEFKDGYFAGTTLVKEPAIVKFDFRSESGKIIIKAYKKNNPSEIIKTVTITPSSCGLLSLKGRYGASKRIFITETVLKKELLFYPFHFLAYNFMMTQRQVVGHHCLSQDSIIMKMNIRG